MSYSLSKSVLLTTVLLSSTGACRGYLGDKPSLDERDKNGAPLAGSTELGASLEPSELALARLTQSQYRHLLMDAFGVAPSSVPPLEEDHFDAGSAAVGARTVPVSKTGVEKYERAAIKVAQMLATAERYSSLSGCTSTDATEACIESAIRNVAQRLFRRTPTNEEVARYRKVATDTFGVTSDLFMALETSFTGLLLSPNFLYREEVSTETSAEGVPSLTPNSLANRLSFFLWDSAPDEALLAAAESGQLDTLEGLTVEVDRMLSVTDKAERGVNAFADGYLSLYRLTESPKDLEKFPTFTPEVQASMLTAARRSLSDTILRRDAPFREVLTTTTGFLDSALGTHLGIEVPAGSALMLWDYGAESRRGGLLTEPAILTLTSRAEETSPTLRGLFVNGLLCREIPPPPVGVNTTIPQQTTPTTRREQFEQHMSDPSCNNCHKTMDPPGFALEYFDAVGRGRETDRGLAIDGTGNFNGKEFEGPRELATVVAEAKEFGECLTEKWLTQAIGREFEHKNSPIVEDFDRVLTDQGGRVLPLLRAIALSTAFRMGSVKSGD